jgi:hypothetical protein
MTSNKMTRIVIVIVAAILFCSCGQERGKINHEAVDTTSVVDDRIKDTTKILVSELPVKFDSTDVLLFAIGLVTCKKEVDIANSVQALIAVLTLHQVTSIATI